MRLLDLRCHTCKLLVGLSTWRGVGEVVKRDKTRCLPFPEGVVDMQR